MLDTMNTEIHKQAAKMIDFNQKAMKWQLDQAERLTSQLRTNSDAAIQISMESTKAAVDSVLAAQRAILDAVAPKAG